jgi:hypothetical protein
MPSKATYLIAFLAVMTVSLSLHYFVWRQLRRVLRKDFGNKARVPMRAATTLFVIMEIPFFFLFFRRHITSDIPTLTQFLLYPFTFWQILMVLWGLILAPQVLVRNLRSFIGFLRTRRHEGLETESSLEANWERTSLSTSADA